jgi:dsRNA-specific ribonuclease
VGRAQGATKKRAEQEAARQVLEHLGALSERKGGGAS